MTDLYGDDQRHGFPFRRFIQSDILLHTVVFDNEVFGLKAIRDLSGFRPDEGRNRNHVRFGSYCRKRLLSADGQYDAQHDRQFETATSQSKRATIQHESQFDYPANRFFHKLADANRDGGIEEKRGFPRAGGRCPVGSSWDCTS